MTGSPRSRGLTLLATCGVLLAGGFGCLSRTELTLVRVGFNPRFSLDRVPVQAEPDPTLGAFRRGPGQSASYLFPDVDKGHRLMQGECYWLAHDSLASAGDFVKLNWEAVVEVQPDLGNGLRFADGDNRWTLCRLDHPEERRNPQIIEGTADPLPVAMTLPVDNGPSMGAPKVEPGPWAIRQGEDRAVIFEVELTEFESTTVDPDRTCIPQQMTASPAGVVDGYKFYQGVSSTEGWVQSCSYDGLGIRPDGDASYVVHWGDPTDVGPGGSALWLRPNLMVVDGRELLARPMSQPVAGTWAWSTPVKEAPPHRWGENFSPNLSLQAVRFFTRDASGVKEYFDSVQDLPSNELCIHRTPDLTPACNWRCAGQVVDGMLTFDLTGTCTDPAGNAVPVAFTPTFDKKKLETSGGAITEPLSWSIEPTAVSDPLYVEFDVVADVSPMAMRMDDLLVDLGPMAQGDSKRGEIRLRNVGGKTVRVDAVGIDPAFGDAVDFDSWILTDPKPVPIPVDLEDRGSEGYELRKAADWDEFPVIETTEGEGYTLGRAVSFDRGAEFTVNGHQVRFQGSQATYDDPAADFQAPLPKAVKRPFQVLAFRMVQTPFTLLPGKSVLVTVRASPSAYGEREARLRVDFSDAADPSNSDSIEAPVLAYGLWGPDASVVPSGVYVAPGGGLPAIRIVLLANDGDMTLKRSGFAVDGRDAAAFSVISPNPASAAIGPAGLEVFEIEFAPDCLAPPPDDYQAALTLETADQVLTVPLVGSSALCRP